MKIPHNSRIKIKIKPIIKNTPDGLLLLFPETGEVHQLNDTAALIWNSIKKKSSLRQIIILLSNNYGIAPKKAENDISDLIGFFVKKGILEV